jgi:L-lactate dehydrogenase complex protein LldG
MQRSEARSEILESVRRNLAASAPFDRVHREHGAHDAKAAENPPPVSAPLLQEVSLTERFRENLVAIGGNCETAKDRQAAAVLIRTIIENCGARKIAVSDADLIGELTALLATDAEILPNASKEDLFECDLGITGAQFGIAETGTLVLESEKEFHRLASLVPPVHICVLETKKMRQTLGEALELLEKDLSRTITFITGPSRTSDIELTLAIGVHGPAQLFVILIDDLGKINE